MSAFMPPAPLPVANPALPTMYDLPSGKHPEEPGLPDEFHDFQPQLLSQTFRALAFPPDRTFTATDLNLYYDPQRPRYYKRPDWFAVVDVPRIVDRGRLSYVIWQEQQVPIVVVELLSPNTIEEDQGLTLRDRQPPSKWEVYESILRIPNYVLFDRTGNSLQIYRLQAGRYQLQSEDRLWLEELGIGLSLWQGTFEGFTRQWLRWYDIEGRWIPCEAEKTELERQRAEQAERIAQEERLRAEQAERIIAEERRRAQAMAERLRALGIDPDAL